MNVRQVRECQTQTEMGKTLINQLQWGKRGAKLRGRWEKSINNEKEVLRLKWGAENWPGRDREQLLVTPEPHPRVHNQHQGSSQSALRHVCATWPADTCHVTIEQVGSRFRRLRLCSACIAGSQESPPLKLQTMLMFELLQLHNVLLLCHGNNRAWN